MLNIKYVVRYFKDEKYCFSIHCDQFVLDDLLAKAKDDGYSVKVVAYKESSSEVL